MNLALTITPFCLISYIAPWIIFKLVGPLPSNLFSWKVWKTYGFEFMILLKKIWSSKFLCYLHHHEIMPQEKKGHTLQDCRMNCMSAPFALITLKSDKILSYPPYNWLCMCYNYLTTNKELVYKCRITIPSQQLNWPIPPYIVYILENIKNTF